MKSMKLDGSERSHYGMPSVASNPLEYPCGLQIHLDHLSIMKLGLKELPEVGAVRTLKAKVEVCSKTESESKEGGEHKSMSLQITDMALGAEAKKSDAAKALYEKEE